MPAQLLTDITGFSQRDIANEITMVDAKNTPFFSMIRKGSQNFDNILMEWPVMKHLDPVHTAIADGSDVSTFENAMASYDQLRNVQQKFRPDGWQVGDLAQNVQNLPGAGSPKARAMAEKIRQLKRMLEASLGADFDATPWSAGTPGVTRGAGSWIRATAQTNYPVPAAYLTATGCIDTTASGSLTETIVQNVLQASFQETGVKEEKEFICGPNHKKAYRAFMEKSSGSTNTQASNRTFTADQSKTITWTVDRYEGDFGSVNLNPSLWLAFYNTTTPTTTALNNATQQAISLARCYGLNLSRWDWVGKRAPRNVDLIDEGGGPRGYVDAIGGTRCYNPRAEIKFAPTS